MGQETSFLYTQFLAGFHLCQLAKGKRKILVKSPNTWHHFDWDFFACVSENSAWWQMIPWHTAATQFQAENINL